MNGTYRPGDGLQNWATTLPASIQVGPRISGNGSPEGTVEGQPGKEYVDNLTLDLWRKRTGISAIGWENIGSVVAVGGGSGSAGTSGIPFMTIDQRNAWVPAVPYAACLLIDSDPPFLLSIWAGGIWN